MRTEPSRPLAVAVVTGATSGIGRAIAIGLARPGMTVWVVGRRQTHLAAVGAEIETRGGIARPIAADLTNDHDIGRLSAAVAAGGRPVDALVHSAGLFCRGAFGTARVDDFDAQYRLNLRAPFLLTQVLLPLVIEIAGQIVFINSSAALRARAGVSQYAATKCALRALADSLREEVHGDGVRVVSVFPGRTATPMQEAVREMEGGPYTPEDYLHPDDVAAVVVAALALPAAVEVNEIDLRPNRTRRLRETAGHGALAAETDVPGCRGPRVPPPFVYAPD